jgi:hypothetical protein
MSRRTGKALLLALALALPARAAGGDVELSATADRDEVALDGTVTLEVTATYAQKGDPGELQLPPFRDFDVVSRSESEQVSFQFVNGAPSFRRTTVYSIALTPHHAGDAVIEPARLTWQGRSYSTQAIKIRVLPAGQAPPPRAQRQSRAQDQLEQAPEQPDLADPFQDVHPGSKDLLLRATVDHDQPYVGQQLTYSLYLLARINVSGIDKLQLPRLDGFWSEEIEAPQQLVGEARIIDGVPYRSFLLRKRALFPLRAGKATIEPAEVEVLTGFGMLFSRGNARRQSQPVLLDVQPLPPGKPAGFDQGNVGEWELKATVEPLQVAVGQPVTLKLVASGRGNVRDLILPRLGNVPGLRAYDATTTDKQGIEQGHVTGTRTVEQLLVPERTGRLEIPSLTLDIFDPVQKQYRTLRTEPARLEVSPAAPGSSAASSGSSQNLLGAGGVRPIRLHFSSARASAPPWTRPWFWPLLALGPFGLAALLVSDKARRMLASDPSQQRVRGARGAARKRLRGAEALVEGGDADSFYAEVARALTGYLGDKQGVVAAGLTRDELSQALLQRGHSGETVRKLATVLDECDRARFSPGARETVARQAMLQRADKLLEELDHKGAA